VDVLSSMDHGFGGIGFDASGATLDFLAPSPHSVSSALMFY